jgi:4-amino-4-deoxy-L-arabinose transferase-like glycosyltransferase
LSGGLTVAGKLANVLLFVGTAVLLRRISAQVIGRGSGVILLLYLSLSPNQIAYSNLYATEPLALFMLCSAVVLFLHAAHWDATPLFLAAGVCFGLAGYVKPITLVVPTVLGVTYLVCEKRRRFVWPIFDSSTRLAE